MQITLSPELERFVEDKLRAGGFASASEVVSAAVAFWKAQEELSDEELEQLRAEIAVGLEQSRRGESVPLDVGHIKAEVRKLRAARGR
jgi:antitoxin ParD1/3/4